MLDPNDVSGQIIGAAMEVHRQLGPGLLESVYEECLALELSERGLAFERQKLLPIHYKGQPVEGHFRIDLLVEKLVIVELKTVDTFAPVHEAQLLTYLRLTSCTVGLLLNFNVRFLRQGIRRLVLNHPPSSTYP